MSAPERPAPREGAGAVHRTRVKICGLTRLQDARVAVDAGADWLGFVIHPASPRHIEPEQAAEIVAALPGITAVAVMVAATPEQALTVARRIGALRVQIHRPTGEWPLDFPLASAIVVPVAADGSRPAGLPHATHLLMLDTAHAELAGGTGETFPWDAARELSSMRSLLLAGGLSPQNVAAAIERVRPFGVDASSSLESAPGVKDAERVREFVAAVRAADRALAGPRS